MPGRLRHGPRFNGGSSQKAVAIGFAMDPEVRATFRKMHERRELLREDNPAEYRRAVLKSAMARATTLRRHVPVSLAPVRGLEGC